MWLCEGASQRWSACAKTSRSKSHSTNRLQPVVFLPTSARRPSVPQDTPERPGRAGRIRDIRDIRDMRDIFATFSRHSRQFFIALGSLGWSLRDIPRHSATFVFFGFFEKNGMSRNVAEGPAEAPESYKKCRKCRENVANVAKMSRMSQLSRILPACPGMSRSVSGPHRARTELKKLLRSFLRRIFCGALCSQTPQLAVKTVRRSILVLKTLAAAKRPFKQKRESRLQPDS